MRVFTPGPWVGQTGHRTDLIRGIHARGGRLVVRFGGIAAPTSGEGQANARLIAAAPDLLAALKAALSVADRATDEFDLARAAIAEAEGRPLPAHALGGGDERRRHSWNDAIDQMRAPLKNRLTQSYATHPMGRHSAHGMT